MQVERFMTPDPACCTPDSSVEHVAQLMRDRDVGAIPVVDGLSSLRPVGIVTDRDIVIRAVADGDFDATVADVVTDDVICATPEMSTAEAAELMSEHQIRRLPVTDDDDRLVGIVSLGDLAVKEGRDTRMGETLENISEGVKRH